MTFLFNSSSHTHTHTHIHTHTHTQCITSSFNSFSSVSVSSRLPSNQNFFSLNVGHDSFIYETSLTHMCRPPTTISVWIWDVTPSYIGHDSFICRTWLIHVCRPHTNSSASMFDMTHLNMGHDMFCGTIKHHEPLELLLLRHTLRHTAIRRVWCVCVQLKSHDVLNLLLLRPSGCRVCCSVLRWMTVCLWCVCTRKRPWTPQPLPS